MEYIFNTIKTAFILSAAIQPKTSSIIDSTRYVFTFGDSYTADGWSGQGDPLLPHYTYCTTAGPPWARQLVDMIDHAELVNLAVSGATSDQSIVYASPPDFRSQTTSFLNFVAPFPEKVAWTKDNGIFAITFGTNDVNNSYKNTPGNGTALYSQDLDSYFATVDRLYNAGARQFLFNNAIPFDRAQIGHQQGPLLQAKLRNSILEFNRQLAAKATAYCGSKPDVKCSVYDTHALFTEIMNNFQSYGFATPDGVCNSYAYRDGCEVDPTVDSTCLGPVSVYVWKDNLHPAWASDTLWAQGVYKQISNID